MDDAEKAALQLAFRAAYGFELTADEKRMLLKLGRTRDIGARARLYAEHPVPEILDWDDPKAPPTSAE